MKPIQAWTLRLSGLSVAVLASFLLSWGEPAKAEGSLLLGPYERASDGRMITEVSQYQADSHCRAKGGGARLPSMREIVESLHPKGIQASPSTSGIDVLRLDGSHDFYYHPAGFQPELTDEGIFSLWSSSEFPVSDGSWGTWNSDVYYMNGFSGEIAFTSKGDRGWSGVRCMVPAVVPGAL